MQWLADFMRYACRSRGNVEVALTLRDEDSCDCDSDSLNGNTTYDIRHRLCDYCRRAFKSRALFRRRAIGFKHVSWCNAATASREEIGFRHAFPRITIFLRNYDGYWGGRLRDDVSGQGQGRGLWSATLFRELACRAGARETRHDVRSCIIPERKEENDEEKNCLKTLNLRRAWDQLSSPPASCQLISTQSPFLSDENYTFLSETRFIILYYILYRSTCDRRRRKDERH